MADDQDILCINIFPHGFPIFCGIAIPKLQEKMKTQATIFLLVMSLQHFINTCLKLYSSLQNFTPQSVKFDTCIIHVFFCDFVIIILMSLWVIFMPNQRIWEYVKSKLSKNGLRTKFIRG